MQPGKALSSIKFETPGAIIVSVSCFSSRLIMTLKKKKFTSCVTFFFFSRRQRKRKHNISDSSLSVLPRPPSLSV